MVEAGMTAGSWVMALIFVVIPLAAYLWRRGTGPGKMVVFCGVLTALWYVSQSTIHAASHAFGYVASGAPVASLQAVPDSWEGFFSAGAPGPGLTGTHWQRFLQLAAPFLIDGALLLLGSWLFQWRHTISPFAGGLILTLTCLRSVFDLVNSYAAGVLRGTGDFQQLFTGYPTLVVHAVTLVLILLGLFLTWSEVGSARPGA